MKLPMKLLITGSIMCFMAIMIGWVAFPMILKSQVKASKSLKPGSEMRDIWAQLPMPVQFKVYIFNVTNPEAIQKGEKPVLKQVGPYHYDEYQQKVDLKDNEEDDTVEYTIRNTWHFNPSKSNGLTGDEVFVYPQLAILGMILFAVSEEPAFVGVVAAAIDSIFKRPNSLFVKLTAQEIMFDGLHIDCNLDDFLGVSICDVMKSETRQIVVVGENLYRLSFLGWKNNTLGQRIRVNRGSRNPAEVGNVLEFNNETKLTLWSGDPCNELNGTDSTIYGPFLYNPGDMVSFIPDLCRSFKVNSEGERLVHGMKTNHYTVDFGDSTTTPEDKCFCLEPESCVKKGALDISNCLGSPIIATLPHFYLADPFYSEGVIGLDPIKEDHEVYIDFEPLTGTPISAWKRLQYNILLLPVPKFKLMRNLSETLLPLFWVAEGVELGDSPDLLDQLKMVFKTITFVRYFKWIMLTIGIVTTGVGGGLEFVRRKNEQNVKIISLSSAQVDDDYFKRSPRQIPTVS